MKHTFSRIMLLVISVFVGVFLVCGIVLLMGSAFPVQASNLDVCPTCLYTTIQDALTYAVDDDTIRVAAGTYAGSMRCEVDDAGVFTMTLCITEDIQLLGGYKPDDFTVRDIKQFTTTLTWDGDPGHIVLELVNGTSATIDGFTITGVQDAPIAAAYIRDSTPTLSNNRFVNNISLGSGGGIYVSQGSNPIIRSNLFMGNAAEFGAGIVLSNGTQARIESNEFISNTAADAGGAIAVLWGSKAEIEANTITKNESLGGYAGGIFVGNESFATINDNMVYSNTAGDAGGGIAIDTGSIMTVTDNTIWDNKALGWGAGGVLVTDDAHGLFRNNEIYGNKCPAGWGGGIRANVGGVITMTNNSVHSNSASGAPGVLVSYGAFGLLDGNYIHHNVGEAGGVRINDGSIVTLTNNIIQGADTGVTIYDEATRVWLSNNTIIDNSSAGIVADDNSEVFITNNIIASNGRGVEINTPNVTLDYNNLWDNTGGNYYNISPGVHDISVDPQFVDPSSDNYHLLPASQCIDNGGILFAPDHDYDGDFRPFDGDSDGNAFFDIGADEYSFRTIYLPLTLKNASPTDKNLWKEFSSPTTDSLNAVSVRLLDDGWAVGDNGTIIRWNGSAWSNFSSPTSYDLNDVTTLSSIDARIVGDAGTILHWDGSAWVAETSPASVNLYGIQMLASDDGWVVGDDGVILHWNGMMWVTIPNTVKIDLRDLDFISAADGWAVGGEWSTDIGWYESVALHWNGSNLTSFETHVYDVLEGVDLVDSSFGWAVGSNNARAEWNGSYWTPNYSASADIHSQDVELFNMSEGWAVGWSYAESNIIYWDGDEWTHDSCPVTEGLNGIDMLSNDLGWAVGEDGTILRYGT